MKRALRSLALLLVLVLIWASGLMAFAARVRQSTPVADPAPADAIIVLTGASDQRIEAAARLLAAKKGARLLISGVNPQATRADVQRLSGIPRPMYECCVDLGFLAENTIGNGIESAEWARGKHYRRLILVTADFHMPRAMIELRAAMPEAQVSAYPVATVALDARRWWMTGKGARRMILEYSKYLAILSREAFLSLGPREAPKGEAPKAEPAK